MDAPTQIVIVYDVCDKIRRLQTLPLADKVEALNTIRAVLHEISPFASEPVDYVKWVPAEEVRANDYNPNSVAPPELEAKQWAPSWRRICKTLLRNDYWCKGLGFTQPKSEAYERYKVIAKERKALPPPTSQHDQNNLFNVGAA